MRTCSAIGPKQVVLREVDHLLVKSFALSNPGICIASDHILLANICRLGCAFLGSTRAFIVAEEYASEFFLMLWQPLKTSTSESASSQTIQHGEKRDIAVATMARHMQFLSCAK